MQRKETIMRLRRVPDTPEHSRLIEPGGPPEYISIRHRDGSISEVCVRADGDQLDIDLRPSLTHSPHIHGLI
jgi:hypothetical protein